MFNSDVIVTACASLKAALAKESLTDLELDGVVYRYRRAFDLSLKALHDIFVALGRNDVSASPKPVIRDAAEEGLIEDVTRWFGFLEARNLSTHIYSQEEAEKVLKTAIEFLPEAKKLLAKIKGMQ